jgi:hypothetical protein
MFEKFKRNLSKMVLGENYNIKKLHAANIGLVELKPETGSDNAGYDYDTVINKVGEDKYDDLLYIGTNGLSAKQPTQKHGFEHTVNIIAPLTDYMEQKSGLISRYDALEGTRKYLEGQREPAMQRSEGMTKDEERTQ